MVFLSFRKGLIFLSNGLHVKWKDNPVCLSYVVLLITTTFLMVTIVTWHPYLPPFLAPWKKLFKFSSLINRKLGFMVPMGVHKCNNNTCHFSVFNLLVSSCTGSSNCDVLGSCCRCYNQCKCEHPGWNPRNSRGVTRSSPRCKDLSRILLLSCHSKSGSVSTLDTFQEEE